MSKTALIIGNSDGIGLALTQELLRQGWKVFGVSRSRSPIKNVSYIHTICKVQDTSFLNRLSTILKKSDSLYLCVYCAGIGAWLNLEDMSEETTVVEVNFLGMVRTASIVIPQMIRQRRGHFIGLSSVADLMLSPESPSYHGSKAGFSNYLESLGLAVKSQNVHVTNIAFGFVNTKMAKGEVKPMMMSVDKAVQHILRCMDKKPIRYTAPKLALPLVYFRRWMLRWKAL